MPVNPARKTSQKGSHLKVFGIKNCDSCRKALKWLDAREASYRFHDVREGGLNSGLVKLWCDSPFAHLLVNRRSTTWRSLSGRQRASALTDPAPALLKNPTLLKRPVFMCDREILAVGFNPRELEKRLP